MEEAWLRSLLESGRSIESIAREVGRDPSTVAYWVNKHGLESAHAPKHAARGGIAQEELELMIAEGLSTRDIADKLGMSYGTVRHWLRRYGLSTLRTLRMSATSAARRSGAPTVMAACARHGLTTFGRRAEGGYRCLKCRADAVVKRRRHVKQVLLEDAGGECAICGYDRSPAALQFHHIDRATKAFGIASRGVARALDAAQQEARKCVLLCANCHAEVEAGLATLPLTGLGEASPG